MSILKFGAVLILCTAFARTFSQDANYWTSQYGPGGYFLPGAVVSNNGDSGVLYINPALLVNSELTLISANATVYHTDNINIKDGAGTGYSLKSNNAGAIPAMVAGNFKMPLKKKRVIIAYGIIQSPAFAYAASQRRDEQANVLNDAYSPGPEYFVGQYLNQNNASNFSLVASAGWRLVPGLSMGVTLEGTKHKQTIEANYYARAIVNPDAGSTLPLVAVEESYYLAYSNIGLIPKAGIAWDAGNNHFGMMVTVPILHVGGSGTLLTDDVVNNLDLTQTGHFPISFFANTRQDDLSAKWKTPLSIAAGFTHDFEKWQLYSSAEYFSKINEYNIITPRPEFFIRPDTGNSNIFTPDLLKLKDARKAVLNFSIGANYRLSEKCTVYFSARTDNTYSDSSEYKDYSEGFIANTTMWDIYHFQLGINLKKAKHNFRTGIYTSLGSTNKFHQDVNLSDPNENNLLFGTPGLTKAKYFSIGFMLSYIHNF